MFRRMLLIAALVFAALGVAAASPAGAQNYGGCTATVSDTTPTPGQAVTVSGTGAAVSGDVFAFIGEAEIGSGVADAAGEFSFSATIPTTVTGDQDLIVACGGDSVESVTITVAAAAAGSGNLPATGSSSTLPLAGAAVAALALGGGMLVIARRRTSSEA